MHELEIFSLTEQSVRRPQKQIASRFQVLMKVPDRMQLVFRRKTKETVTTKDDIHFLEEDHFCVIQEIGFLEVNGILNCIDNPEGRSRRLKIFLQE